MESKKKKLFDKKLLDPHFDRQMRIPDWNQEKIANTTAVCLGVGGLGSQVALCLARLGIKKMFLIDYDVVDSHNLNRQVLYSKKNSEEKKLKVDAAKEEISRCHNIRTKLVTHNINVLHHFDTVVKCIKESTVVFNMIDLGDDWDLLITAVCKALGKPHINGGTMQYCCTFEYYPSKGPCVHCTSMKKMEKEKMEKFALDKVTTYKKIPFIKRDETPIGASNVIVATTCSNLMISIFIRTLMDKDKSKIPNRSIFYMNTYEFIKWVMPREKECFLCKQDEEKK